MDDRRFDSLVRAVATGASRRAVLKGILGLGGVVLTGGIVLEDDTDAARRPTVSPTLTSICPGQQTRVGNACVCQVPPAPGANKCGPDCCTGTSSAPFPRPSTHTECCDGACCAGSCYDEELCCPTNARAGGLPPLASFCENGSCCQLPSVCSNGVCVSSTPPRSSTPTQTPTNTATSTPTQTPSSTPTETPSSTPSATPKPPCRSNADCGACEGCNVQTGLCGSICTDQLPICCQNDITDYCIPAGETCCETNSDCSAPCAGCNGDGYCDTTCESGYECCHVGGDDYICCGVGQCLSGFVCCNGRDACGDQCCDVGQCTTNGVCCPPGEPPCGDVCCDTSTNHVCNPQGICACAGNDTECEGVCGQFECCGADISGCVAQGLSAECVVCSEAERCEATHQTEPCDSGKGYCLGGVCEACRPDGSDCTDAYQCCTGVCHLGLSCGNP